MESLLWSVDDGLAFEVERSVEQHRHSGGLAKSLDKPVILPALLFSYRLKSPCAIDVRDGGDNVPLVFLHIHHVEHETGGIVPCGLGQCEIFLDPFSKDRWSKRTERLTELNLHVDEVLHIRAPGVGKDAPIT